MNGIKRFAVGIGLASAFAVTLGMTQPAPIRVMLLTGQMNASHNWRATTAVLEKLLAETGLFEVTTVAVTDDQVATFNPDWSRYQVVVLNYDAQDWPAAAKASFERFMSNGGGLVSVHSSDNAFPGWTAFNEMIGMGGWRGRNEACGPLWYYRGDQLVSDDSPGRGGSHPGDRRPFKVTVRTADHPITQGLPATWLHHSDELYATLRGPGKNMTVLASGESNAELRTSGTNRDEPSLMVLSFGQGRIFHTTWGHDVAAMASMDFVTTFQRGVEWAATGRVTQRVPDTFPTGDAVSYRWDILRMDPSYAPAPRAAAAAAPPAAGQGAPPAAQAGPPGGGFGGGGGAAGCVAAPAR